MYRFRRAIVSSVTIEHWLNRIELAILVMAAVSLLLQPLPVPGVAWLLQDGWFATKTVVDSAPASAAAGWNENCFLEIALLAERDR